MVLKIRKYPDPILRKKCKRVEIIDKRIEKLINDMFETLKSFDGLGLAAPQVGKDISLFVGLIGGKLRVFINPQILKKTGKEEMEEGCLSFPGIFLKIKRAKNIEVKFQDINGQEVKMKLSGLDARIFQHEFDHLNGILFIDRIPFWKKIFKSGIS